jgi:hypothetical protein
MLKIVKNIVTWQWLNYRFWLVSGFIGHWSLLSRNDCTVYKYSLLFCCWHGHVARLWAQIMGTPPFGWSGKLLPRQHSDSWFRVPQDSWPYFTVSQLWESCNSLTPPLAPRLSVYHFVADQSENTTPNSSSTVVCVHGCQVLVLVIA